MNKLPLPYATYQLSWTELKSDTQIQVHKHKVMGVYTSTNKIYTLLVGECECGYLYTARGKDPIKANEKLRVNFRYHIRTLKGEVLELNGTVQQGD